MGYGNGGDGQRDESPEETFPDLSIEYDDQGGRRQGVQLSYHSHIAFGCLARRNRPEGGSIAAQASPDAIGPLPSQVRHISFHGQKLTIKGTQIQR
jgi:hypothetical protein